MLRRGVALRAIPAHPKRGNGKWVFGTETTGDLGDNNNADITLLQTGA